ncbi:uncharacterized protein RMCC_6496 [Mycolicibacterium canariasense]|uniref:Uncharacterized protein n=1 Tax=Mycolicibacterium canariasense TaxID=228230 RepID=A0A100WJP4_MYCCR|nr:uncharacterized protein RMCC_6496 [Mycolicibacterium canariasense]
MLVLFLVTALGLAGCVRVVDPVPLAAGPDSGFFFAGSVPTYGHPVSPAEHNRLAYLRALRRVDPCGLLTRESLAKIGEIGAVGTMFAFDECDVDIKMAGATARRYISVAVELSTLDHAACQYVAPLLLSRLPGAPPLPGPVQPVLRITPITDQPCDFADTVGRSTGPLPEADRPPIRDGVGVYPVRLAERDPCEIVPTLSSARWDIGASRAHMCALTLTDGTAIRLTLQPQLFEPESDNRLRQSRDGVVAFVDTQLCAASVFLGPPMLRKLLGGDYLQPGDVVIRPAVTVESTPPRCGTVTGIAVAAAKLFG